MGRLVKGMLELLKKDPLLPGRKLLYAEMGYRGDWPVLMPANWNPVMDRMGAEVRSEGVGEEHQQQQQPEVAQQQ